MIRTSLLCLFSLSLAGVGCGSGASAVRSDTVGPAWPVAMPSSLPRDVELEASQPGRSEMQWSPLDVKTPRQTAVDFRSAGAKSASGATAGVAEENVAPMPRAPDFPDRQSIEALDRLSPTMSIDLDKRGDATIKLPSDDYFDAGSANLNESARWRLADTARALAAQSDRLIVIRVYTDALGDPSESVTLSAGRATALRDYFVSRGATADQFRVEGLGPAHPVANNSTSAGRASNRRIEIVIEVNRDSVARR